MRRRPPRSTRVRSSAASDVYKRQEQQRVQEALILQHERGKLVGDREDDMEVAERQQVAGSGGDPLVARVRLAFGAVAVPAGVVREAEIVAAAEALVAMAAERGGTAALDGAHDLVLQPCQMPTGALEELGAGGAEDVGHLQGCLLYTSPSPRD